MGVDPAGKTTAEKAAALRAFREAEYQRLADAVYRRRGWTQDGVPTIAKLHELGIAFPDVVAVVQPYQDAGSSSQTLASAETTGMGGTDDMPNSVYKVIELIGTSSESWEKAAKLAVDTAGKTLHDLRIAEIEKLDLQIEDGKVVAYRAKVKLSFKYHPEEKADD